MKAKVHLKQISDSLWHVFLTKENTETFKTTVRGEIPPTKNDIIKLFKTHKENFARVY